MGALSGDILAGLSANSESSAFCGCWDSLESRHRQRCIQRIRQPPTMSTQLEPRLHRQGGVSRQSTVVHTVTSWVVRSIAGLSCPPDTSATRLSASASPPAAS